jgi:protein TonB
MGNFLGGEAFLENGETATYTQIEESASPQGGFAKFYQHITSSLKYPKEARKARIQGKVLVEFVIARDGTIVDVKCFKGIGGGCDEEAVKAIQSAPAWIPGKQRGLPVRQKMVAPINFSLP